MQVPTAFKMNGRQLLDDAFQEPTPLHPQRYANGVPLCQTALRTIFIFTTPVALSFLGGHYVH